MRRRLLLVACSQRKRLHPGLLPALERYDGGTFRVLRKARREGRWPADIDVMVLSAEYGLLSPETPIAYYERRMTAERAAELRADCIKQLGILAQRHTYAEVYVDMGRVYLAAIDRCGQLFADAAVIYASGRIGERLRRLRRWIEGTQGG